MTTLRIASWVCGLLLWTAMPVNGDSRLSITVSPAQSFAPATLRVRVRVERNPENRTLGVFAESAEFYRSSEIPLDGERAPVTVEFEFRSLPSGDYQVVGALFDRTGHERATARRQMRVIRSGAGR